MLRARRGAARLLSPRELQEREAARRAAELDEQARELVARWRETGRPVDSTRPLPPELYRAVFAREPHAYSASKRSARLSKAQVEAVPRCEVERCGATEDLHAHPLGPRSVGTEEVGVDLMTVCAGCGRRAVRRAAERGRPLTRDEVRALDPEAPLYDRAAIAAIRERLSRPPRG